MGTFLCVVKFPKLCGAWKMVVNYHLVFFVHKYPPRDLRLWPNSSANFAQFA